MMDLFSDIAARIYDAKSPTTAGLFGDDPETLTRALLAMRDLANNKAYSGLGSARELLTSYIQDSRRFDKWDLPALVEYVSGWTAYGSGLDGVKLK